MFRVKALTRKLVVNDGMVDIGEIEVLTSLINNISRQTERATLFELAMSQLTGVKNSLFQFDYVVISTIDFQRNIISSKNYKKRAGSQVFHPKKWAPSSNYPFHNKDVLTYILKNKKVIECSNGKVLNSEIPNSKDLVFNEEIFRKYNHHELARIYIPIIRRAKKNPRAKVNKYLSYRRVTSEFRTEPKNLGDHFLGIAELAYHNSVQDKISSKERALLELYFDNFAQPYFSIIESEIYDNAAKIISAAEKEETVDHATFLNRIWKELNNLLGVSKMDISYPSQIDDLESVSDDPIVFGDLDINELLSVRKANDSLPANVRKNGIFRNVLKTGLSHVSNDVTKDDNYISGLKDVSSQMSVALVYDNRTIGVANIYHKDRDRFNFYTQISFEAIIKHAVPSFFKLRLATHLKKLIKAFDIRQDKFENIARIVIREVLEEYFSSNLIGYFDYSDEVDCHILRCGTEQLSDYNESNLIQIKGTPFRNNEITLVNNLVDFYNHLGYDGFCEFLAKKDVLQVIFIPISFSQGNESLVSYYAIFSSRSDHSFLEDKLLLESVRQKTESALINFELLDLADEANLSSLIIGYAHDIARNMEILDQGIDLLYAMIPDTKKSGDSNFPELWKNISRSRESFIHSFNLFLNFSTHRKPRIIPIKVKKLEADLKENFGPEIRRNKIKLFVKNKLNKDASVLIDLEQLRHVFFNLVRNAIQAIEISSNKKNGAITILIDEDSSDKKVIIKFKDNGIGFTKGAKKQAFIRRFTTKGRFGSGLGLLLVWKIINIHNGEISFTSELGRGTEFLIKLRQVSNV